MQEMVRTCNYMINVMLKVGVLLSDGSYHLLLVPGNRFRFCFDLCGFYSCEVIGLESDGNDLFDVISFNFIDQVEGTHIVSRFKKRAVWSDTTILQAASTVARDFHPCSQPSKVKYTHCFNCIVMSHGKSNYIRENISYSFHKFK